LHYASSNPGEEVGKSEHQVYLQVVVLGIVLDGTDNVSSVVNTYTFIGLYATQIKLIFLLCNNLIAFLVFAQNQGYFVQRPVLTFNS